MSNLLLQGLWKIIKVVLMIQVFNAVLAYFMLLAYGSLITSWTIAALSIFSTITIFLIKTAQEKEAIAPETVMKMA